MPRSLAKSYFREFVFWRLMISSKLYGMGRISSGVVMWWA
jgi:hypothetical protein